LVSVIGNDTVQLIELLLNNHFSKLTYEEANCALQYSPPHLLRSLLQKTNLSDDQRKQLIARFIDYVVQKVEDLDWICYWLLEEHPSDLSNDQRKQVIVRLIDYVQLVDCLEEQTNVHENAIAYARLLLTNPSDLNDDQRKRLIAPLVNYGKKGSRKDYHSIKCAYFLLDICPSDLGDDGRKQLITRILIDYVQSVEEFGSFRCTCFLLEKHSSDLNGDQLRWIITKLVDYLQNEEDFKTWLSNEKDLTWLSSRARFLLKRHFFDLSEDQRQQVSSKLAIVVG
jgi:hypothetical protein